MVTKLDGVEIWRENDGLWELTASSLPRPCLSSAALQDAMQKEEKGNKVFKEISYERGWGVS
jgi:hypothetical protein